MFYTFLKITVTALSVHACNTDARTASKYWLNLRKQHEMTSFTVKLREDGVLEAIRKVTECVKITARYEQEQNVYLLVWPDSFKHSTCVKCVWRHSSILKKDSENTFACQRTRLTCRPCLPRQLREFGTKINIFYGEIPRCHHLTWATCAQRAMSCADHVVSTITCCRPWIQHLEITAVRWIHVKKFYCVDV